MILAWTRGLLAADRAIRAGRWDPASARLRRLGALTAGIVGYGRIGQMTAAKLAAFGTRVLATTPSPPADPGSATLVTLEDLLAASDVVVLHAPLTPATQGLIGAPQLARMRPGGVLITPHIAFSSQVSLQDLRRGAAEEVARVLRGEPARHPRNQPAGARDSRVR